MPPKKMAGGAKKGKTSGGKKKGEKTPQLTLKEAILAFQIKVKEQDLQELAKEYQILKQKNEQLSCRNEQLKNEQKEHIKTLLKQAKENEKEVEQATVVNQEEVEKAVYEKISTMKTLIGEEEELKHQMKKLVDQIKETHQTIAKRINYKDVGQLVHAKQIDVLKNELSDMESSFQEVSAHLDRSLTIAKEEIEHHAQSTLAKQKTVASEEAANSISQVDQLELADNKWLKKEIGIHSRALEEMTVVVEAYEKENLEIMRELFDCKVEDLNLARKFYLACANEQSSSDEEVFAHGGDVASLDGVSDDKLLDNYFHFEDEESSESPRLGPMELQLLSVIGTKKPVHKCLSEGAVALSETERNNLEKTESDIWPVSERMLQTLVIK